MNISEFSINLVQEIVKGQPCVQNLTLSTSNIFLNMVMMHIGSKGHTCKQLTNLLLEDYSLLISDADVNKKDELTSNLTDVLKSIQSSAELHAKIYSTYLLSEKYTRLIENLFEAEYEKVSFSDSFAVVSKVNSWVAKMTKGIIKEVLTVSDISPLTSMILLTTIFFKARWENPYSKLSTTHSPFYISDTSCVDVEMMSKRAMVRRYDDPKFQVMIDYLSSKDMCSIFILPSITSSVMELIKDLSFDNLLTFLNQAEVRQSNVLIPKFAIKHRLSLKNILKNMGIVDLFDVAKCELSIQSSNTEYVSDIFHCAQILVDEEGVTAAAATATIMNMRSLQSDRFVANRPFIYLVYNTTHSLITFFTIVADPSV